MVMRVLRLVFGASREGIRVLAGVLMMTRFTDHHPCDDYAVEDHRPRNL
jgi:hypothetical protein